MDKYEPKAGDVILMSTQGAGLFKKLKDWLLGSQWSHVAIFFDHTKHGLPLVIESIGRGVLIRSLLASKERKLLVLRHVEPQRAVEAAKRAERLADNPTSWYDYFAIPRYVIPRLVWYKLTGRRYGFGYRQNPYFICSELVDTAYNRIIPRELEPPLPHDFLSVKELRKTWEGRYLP